MTKLIDKLRKMQAARDGEAKLGNIEAAEAFAAAINRLMLQNELSQLDLDVAGDMPKADEVIVRLRVDLAKYGIQAVNKRVGWQEQLAGIVAHAHLCRLFVVLGKNSVVFVGTQAHCEVAEFMYGTLVPLVAKMSQKAYADFWWAAKNAGQSTSVASGYRASWIAGFVQRIAARLKEERFAAAAETGNSGTALIRLDNVLARVDAYVKATTKGHASSLSLGSKGHAEGTRDGRAAADRIKLGADQLTRGSAGQIAGR